MPSNRLKVKKKDQKKILLKRRFVLVRCMDNVSNPVKRFALKQEIDHIDEMLKFYEPKKLFTRVIEFIFGGRDPELKPPPESIRKIHG